MNEWYFAQPAIDYRLLAEAIEFYSQRGYHYLETPWIVDHRYTEVTKPAGRRDFYCLDGYLVASGEQSFMSAMHFGELEPGGKYQTVTPCFRDEAVDELHQTWFLKLELIWYRPNLPVKYGAVYSVMNDANSLMSRHIKTQRTSPGMCSEDPTAKHGAFTYDIESVEGIELGSYGYRRLLSEHWIYGTGLALPRFTVAKTIQLTKGAV